MKQAARILAAAALALAGCPAPKAPQARAKPRVFLCHRAKGPIALDGKIDERAWQLITPIDDLAVPVTGAKPAAAANVRLAWDDENLYLAAVLEDRDVTAVLKEHDSETWNDDAVELFVRPSDLSHAYYEFQVTPLGTTLDMLIGRQGAGSVRRWAAWESGMKVAAVVKGTLNDWRDEDKGWVVEVAIPLKAFASTAPRPQLGDRWRFAVCRYNYSVYLDGGLELSSTARFPAVNFHQLDAYDVLEFAK